MREEPTSVFEGVEVTPETASAVRGIVKLKILAEPEWVPPISALRALLHAAMILSGVEAGWGGRTLQEVWRAAYGALPLPRRTYKRQPGVPDLRALCFRDAGLARADLRNADLTGVSLRGADLERAELDYALLNFADLTGARLVDAQLHIVELNGAIFDEADLTGARLDYRVARRARFRGATGLPPTFGWGISNRGFYYRPRLVERLRHVEATETAEPTEVIDLSGYRLQRANLRGAQLPGVNLRGAHLLRADLRGACLRGANLRHARMPAADLRGADLRGADLSHAELQGADLRGADLGGTRLMSTGLADVKLDGAIGLPGQYQRHLYTDGRFNTPELVRALREGRVKDARWSVISNAELEGARLSGVCFDGARFIHGNLRGVEMRGCSLRDATLHHADLTGARLVDTRCAQARLDEAALEGAHLVDVDLEGAQLHGVRAARSRWLRVGLERTSWWQCSLDGASLHQAALWRARSWREVGMSGTLVTRPELEALPSESRMVLSQWVSKPEVHAWARVVWGQEIAERLAADAQADR